MREGMVAMAKTLDARAGVRQQDDAKEIQAFLAWAIDDHFTFLGARDYELNTSTAWTS